MMASVIAIDASLLDDGHRPEVLLFAGGVGEPGIAPGHLDRAMPQERLQALQPHPGIEQLAGKGVPQAVQCVALVREIRLIQEHYKTRARHLIAQRAAVLATEDQLRFPAPDLKPVFERLAGVVGQINDAAHAVLLGLKDFDALLGQVHIGKRCVQQLPDAHAGPQQDQHHRPVPGPLDHREQPSHILRVDRPRQAVGHLDTQLTLEKIRTENFPVHQKPDEGIQTHQCDS